MPTSRFTLNVIAAVGLCVFFGGILVAGLAEREGFLWIQGSCTVLAILGEIAIFVALYRLKRAPGSHSPEIGRIWLVAAVTLSAFLIAFFVFAGWQLHARWYVISGLCLWVLFLWTVPWWRKRV